MIYRLLHYGIRDIFKNLKRILLLNIIIVFISIPIISSIDSIIFEINNENQNEFHKDFILELIPISYDEINMDLSEKLYNYFGKYNYTYFTNGYFSKKISTKNRFI